MKKLLLSLLGITSLIYVACSSDDNATIEENSITLNSSARLTATDSTDAVQLYKNMMKTSEYANYKNSFNLFDSKLGSTHVNFKTKSEWMSWITTNLSSTLYTSVSQFENTYDDMMANYIILANDNRTLFDYITEADADQIRAIMHPEFGNPSTITYPVTTNSCLDDCADAHTAASNAADNRLAQMFVQSVFMPDGWAKVAFVNRAISDHKKSTTAANAAYTECADGC